MKDAPSFGRELEDWQTAWTKQCEVAHMLCGFLTTLFSLQIKRLFEGRGRVPKIWRIARPRRARGRFAVTPAGSIDFLE
jgi:hypothetical protein